VGAHALCELAADQIRHSAMWRSLCRPLWPFCIGAWAEDPERGRPANLHDQLPRSLQARSNSQKPAKDDESNPMSALRSAGRG
jgi:hypothetical protein